MTMWSLIYNHDPLSTLHQEGLVIDSLSEIDSVLVTASAKIHDVLLASMERKDGDDLVSNNVELMEAFVEGGRMAKVTLAHLVSHAIADSTPVTIPEENADGSTGACEIVIEPLHLMRRSSHLHHLPVHRRKAMKRKKSKSSRKPSSLIPPYIFERSDIYCDNEQLHITIAIIVQDKQGNGSSNHGRGLNMEFLQKSMIRYMSSIVNALPPPSELLAHVASTVLQEKMRDRLPDMNGVAFLANGSIIPRKSGASFAPMASPPAIPFMAPQGSTMTQKMEVDMGKLCKYLKNNGIVCEGSDDRTRTKVAVHGLVVPKGVTLIVGGGYHGKSTMLRAIMSGVYNKVLGDGRELCVTDVSAVTVRAEDGRYVNNTNVSAFISNLPIVGSDTRRFCTREASGSTSQAANVSEAIEMGAGAMLVDEDVSAANFMSRDGRMRALVMDESITPLIYRVNGLYSKHGVSSIVVVGGVGDWLDVPNAVIKLDRYVASDALEKAKSISAQFSHGHVQYAGRGTVHRLQWDGDGTPCRRRPVGLEAFGDVRQCRVSLLDGGGKLSLAQAGTDNDADDDQNMNGDEDGDGDSDDEDKGIIDMTRCEQLLGGNCQLYGCGLCVLWLMMKSKSDPDLDLNQLLDGLENAMDKSGGGLMSVINSLSNTTDESSLGSPPESSLAFMSLAESVGHAYRPRRYEIIMALTRMRGATFDELPTEVDKEDLAIKKEAEERKKILAALWANRRNK